MDGAATTADEVRPDFTLDQPYERYGPTDHATWRTLFERQARLLRGRACDEFLAGLSGLGVVADGLPRFEALSEVLHRATRWRIVAVPGLVPDHIFFEHLANRRFPVTWWIRRPYQMDYLQEPDAFHDIYGHLPLLMDPAVADYIQLYGHCALPATRIYALGMTYPLYI